MEDYYPFGMVAGSMKSEVGSKKNEFLYNGKELQSDLGLDIYTYEFRSYDPVVGRWWQPDPRIKENMSSYSWVTNNPIKYYDALGLDSAQRAQAVEMANKIVEGN